jgi:hypothetical protein
MTNQFPGATKMVLSPAAQAVMDAAFPVYDEEEHLYVATGEQHAGMIAAAALRAAVDQAVPEETWLGTEETCYAYYSQRRKTRRDLLAIATELENHQ